MNISEIRHQAELGREVEDKLAIARAKATGQPVPRKPKPKITKEPEVTQPKTHTVKDTVSATLAGIFILWLVFLLLLQLFASLFGKGEASSEAIPPAHADHTPAATEMVEDELPPEAPKAVIDTSPKLNPNWYGNWEKARIAVQECQERLPQLYADWGNWYGENSRIQMCAVVKAENGTHNPQTVAVNRDAHKSRDVGIFQINTYWHCDKLGYRKHLKDGNQTYMGELNDCIRDLQDVETNTRIARQIYEASGWTPWYGRERYLPEFWADRLEANQWL